MTSKDAGSIWNEPLRTGKILHIALRRGKHLKRREAYIAVCGIERVGHVFC